MEVLTGLRSPSDDRSARDGLGGDPAADGPGAVQEEVGVLLSEALPGIGDRVLSASELVAAGSLLARRSDLWEALVPPERYVRWHSLLHRKANYDVWLLAWDPGHQTDWHDHGGSSGCFAVVSGRLVEQYRRSRSGLAASRSVRPGAPVTFGPAHVHNVSHGGGDPALSIHVYSPALTAMTYYRPTAYGFSAVQTVAVDSPHGVRSTTADASDGLDASGGLDASDRMAIDDLLAGARRDLPPRPLPREALEAAAAGAVLVDLRPSDERAAEGEIPGAVAIGRNVLEWRLDPRSDHRIPGLASYDAEIILFCSDGYASSLAAATLRRMGLSKVTDLDGGYHAWRAAGLPTTA
jgi:rhodanese-related sulfurtransferase/predicted metal-dependent enzyme (double-stranded beta helix superfamily)